MTRLNLNASGQSTQKYEKISKTWNVNILLGVKLWHIICLRGKQVRGFPRHICMIRLTTIDIIVATDINAIRK